MHKPIAFLTLILIIFGADLKAQELRSGPMLGQVQMREVEIWLQTTGPTDVDLKYRQKKAGGEWASIKARSEKDHHFSVHLKPGPLEPGSQYEYELFVDGKKQAFDFPLTFRTQELWQWRTDPPEFRILTGSCAYINEEKYDRPGTPYGGEYHIFKHMDEMGGELMLWLGDNIYLREADWYSETGIYERYAHMRELPDLQGLLAKRANIAIWDDHDFGPNNSDRSFALKQKTLEAFRAFWCNPVYDVADCGGITGHYQYADIDMFLLDDRWNRTPQAQNAGQTEQILGDCQIDWLLEALRISQAPYKLVCVGGQVLNSAKVGENMSNYEEELENLLNGIIENQIKGVVFLTGDRHHSELSVLEEGGISIYDLTVSPLTSGARGDKANEPNKHRVQGTYVGERNFATLDFSGPRTQRLLSVTIYDAEGEKIWKKEIPR